jgi:hypothetical protein
VSFRSIYFVVLIHFKNSDMKNPVTSATKMKIQNDFNNLADSLGCKARIGGTARNPKLFEFRGSYTQGFEVWFPIDAYRFAQITNKYPQLQD